MFRTSLAFLALLTLALCSNYTLILHSTQRGALCLDGSPAAMYLNQGIGANRTKYLIFFVGGGFCGGPTLATTFDQCYKRSKTNLGTSTLYPHTNNFDKDGILSTLQSQNPNFYDWTKVVAIYCDGATHQGYREKPIQYKDANLYFRGSRNALEHFYYMDKNYDFYNGEQIVITGISAGGLGTFQWSNYVYDHAKKAKVYSIPDSGFFITDFYSPIANRTVLADQIRNLLQLVQSESEIELPEPVNKCLDKPQFEDNFVACFNPGNYGQFLKAPTLIVESPYDQYSLYNIVIVRCMKNAGPPYSLAACNETVMAAIQTYRKQTLKQLNDLRSNKAIAGAWGPACVQHGFSSTSLTSGSFRVPSATGLTLSEVIAVFLRDPQAAPWLLEDLVWPGNRGCSGVQDVGSLRRGDEERMAQE